MQVQLDTMLEVRLPYTIRYNARGSMDELTQLRLHIEVYTMQVRLGRLHDACRVRWLFIGVGMLIGVGNGVGKGRERANLPDGKLTETNNRSYSY